MTTCKHIYTQTQCNSEGDTYMYMVDHIKGKSYKYNMTRHLTRGNLIQSYTCNLWQGQEYKK